MKSSGNTAVIKSIRSLLKDVPLLSKLTGEQLDSLEESLIYRKVPRNTTILRAGERTNALYAIVSGGAKVLSRNEEGNEVILSLLGVGECFGEMGLIDGAPRSADVVSSDVSELLVIAKPIYMQILAENFELSLDVMKKLVLRLREANRKISSLALLDVYGRVARLLLDFSEEVDGVRVMRKKVTKQDMAKMIGASREMVSRVMKDLEKRAYIRVEDGQIVIVQG